MATLNFPDNSSTGDEYYDTNAGFNYEWNGTVWITKDLATVNNTREIDDISSGFDGSDTTFTLQINGVNIVPSKVQQLIISVGGVMQNPGDDYTVSGSTLTFTNAPLSGLSFVGTILGAAVSLNTISAGTVSPSSLTTTSNYTVGSIKVSGASTIGNFVLTGLTTITDPDVTNLNSSGVGTVSNVIITADNSGLGATVGAAVGVITYFGDATNMTGVASSIFPLVYSPGISSTSQPADTNITTTWNYPLQAGSGTITIRTGSGSGTIVDQFVVGSSSSITISGRTLTLNPAADLAANTEHFVVYPAGSIKSTSGQKENNELITSFTTELPKRYLFASGWNYYGEAGLNSRTSYSSPVQVPGSTWTKGSSGIGDISHTLFTKNDGTLWAWGQNDYGRLALNDTAQRSSPTQVGTDTTWGSATWNTICAYEQNGYAVKTDGTLWGWGYNHRGQLGLNDAVQHSSPVQIGTENTWDQSTSQLKVSLSGCYGNSMIALKSDGTAWSWGQNEWGNLGLNQAEAQIDFISSPTQIGTDTNWKAVGFQLGLKTDGTLWSWGRTYAGQSGQNDDIIRSSPTQIPGTNWADISGSSNQHQVALKDDNTLWVWGNQGSGNRGMLGLNDAAQRSSPTQVPGTTWSQVTGAGSATKAIKTDGTYWFWGMNTMGDAGAGIGWGYQKKVSSPTQIGTDSNFLLKGSIAPLYVGGTWLRSSE
jgi:alpha-tubulin suppressor-like RCC1 family protein